MLGRLCLLEWSSLEATADRNTRRFLRVTKYD